jgi:hypothetical protein
MRGVLKRGDGFHTADIAAVWPVSAQIAPLPVLEIEPCRDPVAVRGEAGDKAKPRRVRCMGAGAIVMVIAAAILL